MKVFKAIIKKLGEAIKHRDEPQVGTLDFETGKVHW